MIHLLAAAVVHCISPTGEPPLTNEDLRWARMPGVDDIRRAYRTVPVQDSRVILRCRLQADGRPANCETLVEEPPGRGFGAAAYKLVTKFRSPSTTNHGESIEGRTVCIPFMYVKPR